LRSTIDGAAAGKALVLCKSTFGTDEQVDAAIGRGPFDDLNSSLRMASAVHLAFGECCLVEVDFRMIDHWNKRRLPLDHVIRSLAGPGHVQAIPIACAENARSPSRPG
jgi:hypothetical protein